MNLPITTTGHQPDMLAMCSSVAKAGLGGIKTAEAAFALTAMALAEDTNAGDSPVAFLRALGRAQRDFHIINGRPTLKADAMLARFQAAGGKVNWLEYSDKRVCGEFSHQAGGTITLDWTIDRAKSAGLVKPGTPWTAHPRAMLRARVISEAIRTVFPGVISGFYTPEEVAEIDAPAQVSPVTQARDLKAEARAAYSELAATDKATADRLLAESHKSPETFLALVEEHKKATTPAPEAITHDDAEPIVIEDAPNV